MTQLDLLTHSSTGDESDLSIIIKNVTDPNVRYFLFEDGTKRRFFLTGDGLLGQFGKGCHRHGFLVTKLFSPLKSIVYHEDDDTRNYKLVEKYRRYAERATFTNAFVRKCLALPGSRSDWEDDGSKRIWDYGVCSGHEYDGRVITVAALQNTFYGLADAINSRRDYRSPRYPFRGYETSIQLKASHVNGVDEFQGWLSLEYSGCANGYYCLLANDGCFIFYEKD